MTSSCHRHGWAPTRSPSPGVPDTQLPEVEGAGGFEVIFDQSQRWTIGRPAEGSALVDEIAPLADGGYLVTMRATVTTTASPSGLYPYVLHADGTIETLDPVDASEQSTDAQPGPAGLTLLITNATTAEIEHVPLPGST